MKIIVNNNHSANSPEHSVQYGHFYIIDNEPTHEKYEIPELYLIDNLEYYEENYEKRNQYTREKHKLNNTAISRKKRSVYIDNDFIQDEVIIKNKRGYWLNCILSIFIRI
jgi:hypothetical protein